MFGFKLFKTQYLYLRIFENKIWVRNISTALEIEAESKPPFSSKRMLVADFQALEGIMRECIKHVSPGLYWRSFNMIIQPMEIDEGGYSEVEIRSMVDSGEHAAAKKIKIVVDKDFLQDWEVIEILNSKDSKI